MRRAQAGPVSLPRSSGTYRSDDGGFSLIEIVVSLAVLMVLAIAVSITLIDGLGVSKAGRQRVAAANLAAREIEIVRNEFGSSDAAAIAVANTGSVVDANPLAGTGPSVIDGTPYTVAREVQWLPTGNGASACDGGSLVNYPSLRLSVAVTWPNMRTTKPVVSETLLTPQKGSLGNTTLVFVAVKVTNAAGGLSAGVSVQVSGPGGTFTDTTDASGCSVFQVGDAGTYQAILDMTGWTDQTGTQRSVKAPITVSAGELAFTQMTYDRAGILDVTLATDAGFALPSALPAVNYIQPNVDVAGSRRTVAATGITTSVAGLWPAADGYSAWSGACLDSDPAGLPTGGTRGAPVVIAPGGGAAVVARLAPVDLTATTEEGSPLAGSVIYAKSRSTCPSLSEQYLTLGTTDGSGRLKTSLPHGSWQLYATVDGDVEELGTPLLPAASGVTTVTMAAEDD